MSITLDRNPNVRVWKHSESPAKEKLQDSTFPTPTKKKKRKSDANHFGGRKSVQHIENGSTVPKEGGKDMLANKLKRANRTKRGKIYCPSQGYYCATMHCIIRPFTPPLQPLGSTPLKPNRVFELLESLGIPSRSRPFRLSPV